jgi:predicted amidohydrolase YtcJ
VVENGKIVFVGDNDGAMKRITEVSEVIDLDGKLMLPGFIDNHVHFLNGGFYLNGIDLRPAKSKEEFQQIIKAYAEKYPGAWITGGNWDHEQWEGTPYPHKEWIDEVVPDVPVFVSRFDGHMAVANSKALEIAGITAETESPDGGYIEKDPETGEPTGILKDNAHNLITPHIPAPTEQEYTDALDAALNEAMRLGITSVQDITYGNDFPLYKQYEEEGKLTCRIYTRLPIARYTEFVEKGVTVGNGSELLKYGSLKAFADGSLGSSTAWFFEPYEGEPDNSGLAMDIVTNGNLHRWALDADRHNMQLSVHAIGDKANRYMLDLFQKILLENPCRERRHRIEHAQHVRFEDIPLFAKFKVIASVQPYHCIDDGVWAEKRIGKERINYTYPFRSFLDEGVKICFGTDWPVAPLNPLLGIYAAVTRRTLDGKNPGGWIPEQKIPVEEAIRCYTINSAYASYEECCKGSIEVGKYADLIVLSDDILTIDPVKIKDATVEMTVFNGKILYTAE